MRVNLTWLYRVTMTPGRDKVIWSEPQTPMISTEATLLGGCLAPGVGVWGVGEMVLSLPFRLSFRVRLEGTLGDVTSILAPCPQLTLSSFLELTLICDCHFSWLLG